MKHTLYDFPLHPTASIATKGMIDNTHSYQQVTTSRDMRQRCDVTDKISSITYYHIILV